MEPRLSIVVAVKDGASNVPALLGALKDRDDNSEVILCCAGSADCNADASVFSFPAGTLVPTLWSEGILRARGSRVALTTAQLVHQRLGRATAIGRSRPMGRRRRSDRQRSRSLGAELGDLFSALFGVRAAAACR